MLVEVGHVTQNMYLQAIALGLAAQGTLHDGWIRGIAGSPG